MAQVTITQLPQAGSLTGDELVPIVQNGVTVHTTTGDIATQPTQTQSFLTVNQETSLGNSRYLAVGTGLDTTDNGAQGTLQITMTGAASSLNAAGTGFMVKSDANTLVPRAIAVAVGLDISNGNGVSANPTISLGTFLSNFQSLSGSTGLVGVNGGLISPLAIAGTSNQISVTNGDGAAGNPTVGIASNPTLPGSGGTILPTGDTASRPVGASNGTLRYNTDLALFEGYANDAWGSIATGGGVTSVGTGLGLTGGPITSTGTIAVDDAVVATFDNTLTLTNKTISGSSNTLSNIGNSSLTNSAITINGSSVSLGGSTTVTATASNALTIGTGLSGTSYDGSAAVTIAIDSTVATLTGSQALTNKTISGGSNTLTNIANASLTNSSVTLGTTTVALGATSLTLGGLTSVAVTQDPTTALQLATKQYVDSVAQGLSAKAACLYSTTADILLTGLTTQAGGDWPTTLTAGDRILVKNQTLSQYNGIYVADALTWSRATDMSVWSEVPGSFVFVQAGTALASTGWTTTAPTSGTIDVTAMPWTQFSGAGTYTAGTGLTLLGSQFSITNTAVTAAAYGSASKTLTATVNAQGQLTALADTDIAIAASQITSGTLGVARGGIGVGTLTGLAYGNGTSAFTAASAAEVVAVIGSTAVTNATNATNTAITVDSTNATNYLSFVSATTGNLPQLVNSSITCNPSTGSLTGGIMGGAF